MVVIRIALAAALLVPSAASAAPTCLPKAALPPGDDFLHTLDLGLVDGKPTLCAPADRDTPGVIGCWTINPKTGALSASPVTGMPGHAQHRSFDAKGCIDGYCPPGAKPSPEPSLTLFVVSTDGKHAALLHDAALQIFDTTTKKPTKTIPLVDEKGPDNANVGNAPIDLLYTQSRLYVVGTDAGPYIGVWAYKDDGTRIGLLGTTPGSDGNSFNVYQGGWNVIDANNALFADAGFEFVTIVNAEGKVTKLRRKVKTAPCTAEELVYLGEVGDVSKACRRVIAARLEPYVFLDPVALPDGTYLASMAGKNRGTVVVLDGKTLAEKKRFKLKRCTK